MPVGNVQSTNHMRYWGLASGLDVDEIVSGLVQAERAPLDRLLQKRQLLQWEQEAFRDINRRLRELRDVAFDLRLESTFQARSVSVSDEGILTAGVSAGAALGSHTLKVESLATGVRFFSAGELGLGAGGRFEGDDNTYEFTIRNGDEAKEFTFNAATDSIHTLVRNINDAGLGLQAFYDADLDRLFVSSTETGDRVDVAFEGDVQDFLVDKLRLAVADAEGGAPQAVSAEASYRGQNAKIVYNGLELEQSGNRFTIGGVTYNLHRASAGTEVTVRVGQDVDGMVETIKEFVELYNEVLEKINGALTEKRHYDYPPLTQAQRDEMSEQEIERWEEMARSGVLRGDNLLTRIGADIRAAMGGMFGEDGAAFRILADIGIATGSWEEMGRLHLDESKLRAALQDDADGVAALFRQDGTGADQGIIRRLTSALDGGMERIGNRVGRAERPVDDSAIGRQIGWINDAIEQAEERLERREAYLYRQFTTLETFLSQMNTQSLWLAQTFMGGMM